jgi:TorA maturation chaperone TorD
MVDAAGCAAEPTNDVSLLRQLFDAAAGDLHSLAALHDREAGEPLLSFLRAQGFPGNLGLATRSEMAREGAALLERALSEIGEPVAPPVLDELAADYAAIYLNHVYRASPCESVWVDSDGLTLQEATFQVRSWYKRFGLAVENWRKRADDHVVAQLHFLAILFSSTDGVQVAEIARFMDEHLLRWLPRFASRVASRCATRFYAGAALLTAGYCEELRDLLAEILGQARPTAEEIERRMKSTAEVKPIPLAFVPGKAPSW